jgi:excisionase family DNA binding protein
MGGCYTFPDMSETAGFQIGSDAVALRFATVSEVARRLRVSNMTVYRLVKAGQLPAVRVGRGYRIREEDVLTYLENRYMDAG